MDLRAPLLALALLGCKRNEPARPAPPPAHPAPDAGAPAPAAPAAVVDAGPPAPAAPPAVLVVRVRNEGAVPLRLLTNPDLNELLVTKRVNLPPGASERAALTADGTRVSLFPIGQMPRCDADAGAGYGGLGQQGEVTLAPGESREFGRWDGVRREEVNDPQRGVCARESAPEPGRYRMHLDQPQLEGRPTCTKVMFAWPVAADGGGPITLEIRCRAALPDGGVAREFNPARAAP